jgi:isoleucyl-tRNA synthetase
VATELNVGGLEPLSGAGDLGRRQRQGQLPLAGQAVRQGRAGRRPGGRRADAAALAAGLRAGTASVEVGGEQVALTARRRRVTETPRSGLGGRQRARRDVALDLDITPALRRAGLVREAVRLVQDARKGSGLEVSDRIELWWAAESDELAEALREGAGRLGDEVLAVSVVQGPPTADVAPHEDAELGLRFWLRAAGA